MFFYTVESLYSGSIAIFVGTLKARMNMNVNDSTAKNFKRKRNLQDNKVYCIVINVITFLLISEKQLL